ncbi:MASE1 domain-containing protein [Streptomyces sp. NPDC048172]|uniref:MASE1 domain-containing protein n=1 Tax=Streptomyces sp. NPDC048172 TaxID=3365505 RepID=UPI00371C8504
MPSSNPFRFRKTSLTALARVLVVALAYYAAGRVGLLKHVEVEGAIVTPLWPPTGVALSCLLLMGLRVWPGIALGTFGIILTISSPDATGLVIATGNTVAPIASYLLLRRVGFRLELDRLRDGLALVFLGALAGMLISATTGPSLMLALGQLEPDTYWPVWSAWWTGDAMGVLVFTPLLLLARKLRMPRDPVRVAEGAGLAVTALVLTPLVMTSELSLLFLTFPLLVWSALRFQLAGSAPCAALASVAATSAATDEAGPFAGHSFLEGMVTLQAFNGSVSLTALLLAALVTEQLNIRRSVERACLELTELVEHLSPGRAGRQSRSWPPQR